MRKEWGIGEQPKQVQQSPMDMLLGRNGPRYQLFPERLARGLASAAYSGFTLPHDVMTGEAKLPSSGAVPGSVPFGDPESAGMRVADMTMFANPMLRTENALLGAVKRPLSTIEPETAALAKTARDTYGIPIRGGQMSESRSGRFLDSVLQGSPFSGYGENVGAQHTGFNRAVSRSFGEDAEKITPEVMLAAKKRIGNVFDTVAERTTINADEPLKSSILQIMKDAQTVLPREEAKPIFNQLMNIASKISKDDTISGETYLALTRKGAPLSRAQASPDPNVKFYANQIVDAMRGALERSATPRYAADLRKARSEWAAMKTVEDLAEKSPTGDISPALLLGQVRKTYDNFAYGGGGDLGQLARIGQRFMKEPANSGTADRLWWMKALGMMGAGSEGAMLYHDPMLALKMGATAGASAGANRLLGSYMKSDAYANRLINNSLGPQVAPASAPRLALPYIPQATYLEQRGGVPQP